jgi:glycosyltransferase involved in cell wall biosynthesis
MVKPRLIAVVPLYLPYPGGAEKSMHEMLRLLAQAGWTVEALVPGPGSQDSNNLSIDLIDGVRIRRLAPMIWLSALVDAAQSADVLFFSLAHLFRTSFSWRVDGVLLPHRSKTVYFCRGAAPRDYFPARLVVANSCSVLERIRTRPDVKKVVLTPIISAPRLYPARVREFVTLINPTWYKGGHLFLELAHRFSAVPFLAQLGRDTAVRGLSDLNNVTIQDAMPEIDETYARTKVLLVPSRNEPFGRVAMEGALAGCQLLLHRAGGLAQLPVPDFCYVENLQLDEWEQRLAALLSAAERDNVNRIAQIQKMVRGYDPGWDLFLRELDALRIR